MIQYVDIKIIMIQQRSHFVYKSF